MNVASATFISHLVHVAVIVFHYLNTYFFHSPLYLAMLGKGAVDKLIQLITCTLHSSNLYISEILYLWNRKGTVPIGILKNLL